MAGAQRHNSDAERMHTSAIEKRTKCCSRLRRSEPEMGPWMPEAEGLSFTATATSFTSYAKRHEQSKGKGYYCRRATAAERDS